MPELPKVSQEFDADADPYLAALQEMIAQNERLISSMEEAVAKIQALIDSIEGKKVDIELNLPEVEEEVGAIKAAIDSIPDHKNVLVTVEQAGSRIIGVGPDGTAEITNETAALRDQSEAMIQVISDVNEMAQAESRLFSVTSEGTATLREGDQGMADLAAEAARAGDAMRYTSDDVNTMKGLLTGLVTPIDDVTAQMLGFVRDTGELDAGMQTVAGAALAAVKNFSIFGIGLTGLHWILMLTFEGLSTLIPALTALGAAVMASLEGVTWLSDKMEGVYQATEATSGMLGVTAGQFVGLAGALQDAQTAADPLIYEALGGALNGLTQPISNGKTLFQGFFQEGYQVIAMLDQFIAKVDVELRGALGSQLTSAFANGTKDLQEWGEVLGNLLHIITNIATAAPGAAEVLLNFLTVVTKLLVALTNNQGLVTFIMLLEEAYRWGGLLAKVFAVITSTVGNVVEAFAKIAGSMAMMGDLSKAQGLRTALLGVESGAAEAAGGLESAAGVLTGPWGVAIGAGAILLGVLIDKMATSRTAAQQWADSMQDAVNKATPTQGLADILTDLPKLNNAYNSSSAAAKSFANASDGVRTSLGRYDPQLATAAQNTKTFTSTQQQMITQAVDIMSENVKVGGSYVGLSEAMALASAAGLTVGQMFNKQGQFTQVAAQAIQNMVRGYQEMDQTGTTLSNDVNVINEQMLMQQTDVDKLNKAWDGFIQQMTGVSSGVASLYTDLQTIGNVTETATNKIQAFSQGSQGMNLSVKQVAEQLKSFGASSAQVWSNFDSALNQGETAIDGLRTAAAAGGISNAAYTESVKGVVAQMLPYVQESGTATSMLSALGLQAGGDTTTSFQKLSNWVGSTKNATDTLNKTVQSASTYMANLSKAAANLSSTLDSAVAGAVTQGTIDIKGIAGATQTLTTDFQKNSNQLNGATTPALKSWASEMHAAGTPLADAKAMLDQLLSRWGATPGEIAKANAALASFYGHLSTTRSEVAKTITSVDQLANAIAGLPSTKYINIIENQKTYTISAGGAASPHASGGRIPGYGGGDIVPAMLEPGEAIVPKHLVGSVAPILKAHGVPGFASGGTVGNASDLSAAYAALDALYNDHTTPQAQWDQLYDAAWNRINADKAVGGTSSSSSSTASVPALSAANASAEAAAARANNALIAKFATPTVIPSPLAPPPQFLGGWLPSSLTGLTGATSSVTSPSGQPQVQLEATHPAHITVHMDGKAIWNSQQKVTLKYNLRNNGIATGLQKPR